MRNPNKNFYNFLLLWSGEFISAVGSGLTSFGLGVYVFEQTGQASAMALVTLLAFLPGLLLSVPAGVLADRYDRRPVSYTHLDVYKRQAIILTTPLPCTRRR